VAKAERKISAISCHFPFEVAVSLNTRKASLLFPCFVHPAGTHWFSRGFLLLRGGVERGSGWLTPV
jgi:hypothetical protein